MRNWSGGGDGKEGVAALLAAERVCGWYYPKLGLSVWNAAWDWKFRSLS